MDSFTGFSLWRTKAFELHADLATIVDIISNRVVGIEIFKGVRRVEPAEYVCLLPYRPPYKHLAYDTATPRGGDACTYYVVDVQAVTCATGIIAHRDTDGLVATVSAFRDGSGASGAARQDRCLGRACIGSRRGQHHHECSESSKCYQSGAIS